MYTFDVEHNGSIACNCIEGLILLDSFQNNRYEMPNLDHFEKLDIVSELFMF